MGVTILKIGLLAWGLTFSAGAFAQNKCERTLLPSVPSDLAMRFLVETLDSDLNSMGDRWAIENAAFRRWLSESAVKWPGLSASEKYLALSRYFSPLLAKYIEGQIPAMRDNQLLSELIHRGASKGNARNGYDLLRQLSRKNLERLTKEFKSLFPVIDQDLIPPATQKEISETVSAIDFAFVHNTTGLDRRPTFPLLSSRELVSLGIDFKLNTQPFNSEILKSDGNIYFFAVPYSTKRTFPTMISNYGNTSIILNRQFASQWGWMSPFIMYPRELIDFARLTNPSGYQAAKSFLPNELLREAKVDAVKSIPKGAWSALVGSLHLFDMKPEDYLSLIRQNLTVSLSDLYLKDGKAYAQAIQDLQSEDRILPAIDQYALGALGITSTHLSRTLELKVPVTIAPSELDVRPDPKRTPRPPKPHSFDHFHNDFF